MSANALAKIVKRLAQEVLHLLGWFVQKIVNIAQLGGIEADLDFLWPQYLDFRRVAVAAKVLGEPGLLDFLERVIFAVGIDDKHRRPIFSSHQLLEQYAGSIALACPGRRQHG